MKLKTIHAGYFKLDGGAMFGIVPKQLWNRMIDADEKNMCTWAMQCLLIEVGERKILVDTGMGNKQDAKFQSHFDPHGPEQERLVPSYPNAKYWIHKKQYEWAIEPNYKEKASFLKENFVPLVEEGVAEFIDFPDRMQWHDGIEIRIANGHTSHMMYLLIPFMGTKLVYCADLMPSKHHIGLPYIMAYDVQPLVTLKEKTQFLNEALENQYLLYFEHDANTEVGNLTKNNKGRIVFDKGMQLSDLH
jgi:glyoxylase-like metal-dependent hydrolase (beta-lactamase superfamily II)